MYPVFELCYIPYRSTKPCLATGPSAFMASSPTFYFPTFTLRIDNNVNNLVSYGSIGRLEPVKLDYTQPQASQSSSIILLPPNSPNIIEPDSEDEEMPTYHILAPKATTPPPIQPPHPARITASSSSVRSTTNRRRPTRS